ncbi:MAG: alpha/beta fold hydrolase [Anaerolineales bacterium]
MKRQLRGIKRSRLTLDFNLYRRAVPIPGIAYAELSVVDIMPEGAHQTLVFVHGYAGCAETWEHQIHHFTLQRNFRVVAPDLRGHGQSDAPFSRYTMDELVADLHAIAVALELPERFILVGHSFGGSVCVEYAVAHPERLEKLILIATATEYPLPRAVSWFSRVPVALFRPLWRYRPRWNAEIHVMKRMMLNNLRRWRGHGLLANIQTPTLVITGERDTYFPRSVFQDVIDALPAPEVVDVGSAKHKVQLERHEAVNRAVERFVVEDARRPTWRLQGAPDPDDLLSQRPWLDHYDRDTPHTIPIPRQPLHKFLESAADWAPKQIATLFYGARMTYQELEEDVNRLAHALLGLGVVPGDRVMIILPDMPQFIVAYYATLKIGGVVVLPNPDANAAQITLQASLTEAKILVTLLSFSGLASQVRDQNAALKKIIFADIRQAVSGGTYKHLVERWGAQAGMSQSPQEEALTRSLGTLMARLMLDAPTTPPDLHVKADQLACIIFTSGTTDMPKGVCLTHYNLVANTLQTRHWMPDMVYAEETFLSVLPLLHSYGMTNAMNIPIAIAATIILHPVFELDQVLEDIKTHKPTIFPGVPSMYMAINGAPNVRSYGLSSIRACLSGAAPLPVEVQEAFEKLTQGRLVEGYGLTEASPVTHANPLKGPRKTGSIGVPLPNTDARIVDLVTDEDCPPGQVGELVIRGPQVMQGYLPDESGDAPESVLKDGWLYTGDVAVMDADGFFQIISRKRDTIMAGDYSVYPRDVEEVLYENSKVVEVAVVGVQTVPGQGEQVKAFVVPRPNSGLTKDELLDLCRRRLDAYAVPWEIEFREALPKSFVGKVLRRLLVEEQDDTPPPNLTELKKE